MTQLRRLARLKYGDALATETRLEGEVPVMSSGGITGRHSHPNTTAPAIIIGRKGSYGSVHWTDVPAFVIDTAYYVDAGTTNCDLRWLYYVLLSVDLRGASQDVGVPGLSRAAVYDIELPTPPQREAQRRTADWLDEQVGLLDRTVELRREQESQLLARRAAGVLAAVTGADHPSGHAPGRLPWAPSSAAAWPVAKITYHARLGSGHTPSRNRPEWWTDCTIPWVTTGEVWQMRSDRLEDINDTRERISLLGLQNSSAVLHPRGTVVLCRTAASAGYSAVMGTDMATSQDLMTWTCEPSLNPYYLLWCLRAMRGDLLSRLATGSTHKTIYVPDIQTLRIPVPPREEQDAIVDRIREDNRRIDALVDLGRQHLALLEERKRALITAAVTGQVDLATARGAA